MDPALAIDNLFSDQTIFSLNTQWYSFKCITNHAECRDELRYLFTNRFVGSEVLSALSMPLNCDRYECRITVTETVNAPQLKPAPLLGLSTYYTIDAWLAKGVGFVKGSVNGNSLSPAASMGGSLDSNGVLHGYYISPRVSGRGDTDFARFVWAIFSRRRRTAERHNRIQRIHPCAKNF